MTFQQAVAHYSGLYPEMNSDEVRIRKFCDKVRSWVCSGPATEAMVEEMVLRAKSGIATVDWGAIKTVRSKLGLPPLPKNAFVKLLNEMFRRAASSSGITEEQYNVWKDDFFKEAGFRAETVFNRLLYPLFPEQFCSVVKPERLRKVGERMCGDNLLPASALKSLSGVNWFRLCAAIMPAARAGLQGRDHAHCTALLAAIGVVASR